MSNRVSIHRWKLSRLTRDDVWPFSRQESVILGLAAALWVGVALGAMGQIAIAGGCR